MGATVDFKVHIAGSNLSCYQWSFNGSNVITFGTNCVLELTNVQFSQSGAYTVVITNLFGAVRGGFAENFSMLVGNRAMILAALAIYFLALLAFRRKQAG